MKITVVIPLFNKEKSILRAVHSVLHQSEQDFELIVVNDGSTDHSASLIEDLIHDKRIRLVHQENAGASAARNRGAVEARAELIAFLDADDEWHPEFLSTILELQAQFPEGSVFGTLYSVQRKNGEVVAPDVTAFFEPGYRGFIENFLSVLRSVLPFNNSSFAVTKQAFQQIGGFPTGIPFGEDVDIWIRLSIRYKVVYIAKPLTIYHQDAENRACDLYYPSMDEYYPVKHLVQMMAQAEVPKGFRQPALEYIAKHQLALAKSHLYSGNPKEAGRLVHTCSGTRIYFTTWAALYLCTFIPPRVLKSMIKIKNVYGG